jgi:broad specificity phosphatase PhoE
MCKWLPRLIFILLPLGLISCSTTPIPTTYTVYLTRHFEKAQRTNDPELSIKGQKQAEVFASLLDNKPITAVYSTKYKRATASIKPLAARLNLTIQEYEPSDASYLIDKVTENQQDQVIVGHSNTIPDLVRRLGGQSQRIADSEYGIVFAVSITLLEGERTTTDTRKIWLLDNL